MSLCVLPYCMVYWFCCQSCNGLHDGYKLGSLSAEEMADLVKELKLKSCEGAATPGNTIIAQISVDISKKGLASPFMRVSPGYYGLREWLNQDSHDTEEDEVKQEPVTLSRMLN